MNKDLIFEFVDQEIKNLNSFYEESTNITYKVDSELHEFEENDKDGFTIEEVKNDVSILGRNARSVLYAVYDYFEDYKGYNFVLNSVGKVNEEAVQVKNVEARFARRGNILEVINDVDYVKSLIDQGGKNKLNEFFFTFKLWDEISDSITKDLAKRGMDVCLGGHSLNYLLNDIMSEDTKNVFNLSFFEDEFLMNKAIEKVINTCKKHPIINRLSMWPADFGISSKQGYEFMNQYITFIEKLKSQLKSNDIDVSVEHIVYNAGLSWEMLERDERVDGSTNVDVLYAYWGRDYSESIESKNISQKRAYATLEDWKSITKANNTEFTVLEYYSDFYMMSELFPPLANRITDDLNQYETGNVTGVLNLIVPLLPSNNYEEIKDNYEWQWFHLYNNHIYSGLAWGKSLKSLKNKWFEDFQQQKQWYKLMDELEMSSSKVSKFNRVLFNKRVVDLNDYQKENFNELTSILEDNISVLKKYEYLFLDEMIDHFKSKESIEYKTKYYLQTLQNLYIKTLDNLELK